MSKIGDTFLINSISHYKPLIIEYWLERRSAFCKYLPHYSSHRRTRINEGADQLIP